MQSKRRNDPAAPSVRASPSVTFRKRFLIAPASAAGLRNRAPAVVEAQVLGPQRDRQGPPPRRGVQSLAHHANGNLRLQRAVERLYRLGPRPVMELLVEVAGGADLDTALATYARLDPEVVRSLDGDRFPAAPIHKVPDSLIGGQP